MPLTSDASAFTSVTASPNESHEADGIPLELKIPLPSSESCSEEEKELSNTVEGSPTESTISPKVHMEDINVEPGAHTPAEIQDDTRGPIMHEELVEEPSLSLAELAHLVNQESYQRLYTSSTQARVDQLILSCGLDRRLISTFSIAYGNLIDQYKTDDQPGFAGLFEECEQLQISCGETGHSLGSQDPGATIDDIDASSSRNRSCLQELPTGEQNVILVFLTRIRTEPEFLSSLMSQLTPSELAKLTSSYHPAGIDLSILTNHSHGRTQQSNASQMMKVSRRRDSLRRFHKQDPFFALLYSVFDSSSDPGSPEFVRRTEVWSTVCARVFSDGFKEGGSGSNELPIATLDAFANFQTWTLVPKIDIYLRSVLVEGAFLLDAPPSQSVLSREPLDSRYDQAATAEADFFDKALMDLFQILDTGFDREIIPISALGLVHAILRKIQDSSTRLRAKRFIFCIWFFGTFMSSTIAYPEVRGLLMTQHIGATSRQLILRKLVVKMQERVLGVIIQGESYVLSRPEMRTAILAIFRLFEPPEIDRSVMPSSRIASNKVDSRVFLTLSPLDVVEVVETLCPAGPPPGTEKPPAHEIVSTPPSTAGSSTLNPSSSSVLTHSLAPSLSLTLSDKTARGETFIGDRPAGNKETGCLPKEEAGSSPANVSSSITSESLILRVKAVCQKLKDLLGRDKSLYGLSPLDSWTSVYASKDGYELSLDPEPLSACGDEGSPAPSDVMAGKGKNYGFLKQAIIRLLADQEPRWLQAQPPDSEEPTLFPYEASSTTLESMIEGAMTEARSYENYETAHYWWKSLGSFRAFCSSAGSSTLSHTLFQSIAKDCRARIDAGVHAVQKNEIWIRSLIALQQHQRHILTSMDVQRKALRVKMWYVSDVRHSAVYEEASNVARALRAMASPKPRKQATGVTNWARQRLRGSSFDKSEAQTLEAVAASKDFGGPSKLADEQIELTSRWLTRKSIENFCRGEERIHRFSYQIQKSVGKIAGVSPLENPVLWSSNLFKREKSAFDAPRSRSMSMEYLHRGAPPATVPAGYNGFSPTSRGFENPPFGPTSWKGNLDTNQSGGFWSSPQISREFAGLGIYDSRFNPAPKPMSPQLSLTYGLRSGLPIPPLTPPSPLSCTGKSDLPAREDREASAAKKLFIEQINTSLCSLLVSDLGNLLWNSGSETDTWVNDHAIHYDEGLSRSQSRNKEPTNPVSTELEARVLSRPSADALHDIEASETSHSAEPTDTKRDHKEKRLVSRGEMESNFPFAEAYTALLRKVSLSPDPWIKLKTLHELEQLILRSIEDGSDAGAPADMSSNDDLSHLGHVSSRSRRVPRTKTTYIQEAFANCADRRDGTLQVSPMESASRLPEGELNPSEEDSARSEKVVDIMLSIFHDSSIRPKTLFRDLQYIAAFVAPDTLDNTAQGKAFWNVGLAALALKEDLSNTLTHRAFEITAYHISTDQPSDPAKNASLASTTLRDAANLLLITAKEGSPVAARELGLFYLTHPDLIPRVTIAMSKAADVFKSIGSNDSRSGDKEKGALDPLTFDVVVHWMDIAANGSDKVAAEFMKGDFMKDASKAGR